MQKYRVIIPDEHFQLVHFRQEDLPGIAAINSGLKDFEPKGVFLWHLSVMIQLEDLIDHGLPSQAEVELLEPWEDQLDSGFKGGSPAKPNALCLARITWRESRELIYRVHDPEPANGLLQDLIESKQHPRPFDFRIDRDPEWKLGDWHLNTALQGEQGVDPDA